MRAGDLDPANRDAHHPAFQERMPYGLFVPDIGVEYGGRSASTGRPFSHPEAPILLEAGHPFAAAMWPVQKMMLRAKTAFGLRSRGLASPRQDTDDSPGFFMTHRGCFLLPGTPAQPPALAYRPPANWRRSLVRSGAAEPRRGRSCGGVSRLHHGNSAAMTAAPAK
jgi:hypothetical protein